MTTIGALLSLLFLLLDVTHNAEFSGLEIALPLLIGVGIDVLIFVLVLLVTLLTGKSVVRGRRTAHRTGRR